jgi:AcrR family transcriptional regulator
MADISKAARMSVGQIYRYFPSKEAIVHGIVERIVESRLRWINTHNETRAEMPERVARRLAGGPEFETREERVLMLEVMAEATRSAEVAQILREADNRLRAKGLELIQRACPEFSEQQVQGVLELLVALAEGTAMRRVTGLQGDENMDTLISMYRDVLEKVLAPRD